MILKKALRDRIERSKGNIVSRDQLMYISRILGHRESNAERRLRELAAEGLISPVFTEMKESKRKYIEGYKWL